MTGKLKLTGWHGYSEHPVEVLRETPKRYEVRILEDGVRLPSRRVMNAGDTVLVPKHAVRLDTQPAVAKSVAEW